MDAVQDERLIVALDFHDMEEAKALVEKLDDRVVYYKVGMELFYRVGATAISYLKEREKKVFLDLKLHDIPNTVAGGLCSLMGLGADMLNLHAGGGYAMMQKSAEALRAAAEEKGVPCPKLIAVTILTSIDEGEWAEMGYSERIGDQVLRFAGLAKKAGLDGVVASPRETAAIREACGKDFLIVTPGIRPAGSSVDDQSRIASPKEALGNGATHLVVGRPIRSARDPRAAAESILREMEEVK